MDLNWSGGFENMFSMWSKERHSALEDQREFERQEKLAQANQRRNKELYSWKKQQETTAADAERTRASEARVDEANKLYGNNPDDTRWKAHVYGDYTPSMEEKEAEEDEMNTLRQQQKQAPWDAWQQANPGIQKGSAQWYKAAEKHGMITGGQSPADAAREKMDVKIAEGKAMADAVGAVRGTRRYESIVNRRITGEKAREKMSEKEMADHQLEVKKASVDFMNSDAWPEFAKSFQSEAEAQEAIYQWVDDGTAIGKPKPPPKTGGGRGTDKPSTGCISEGAKAQADKLDNNTLVQQATQIIEEKTGRTGEDARPDSVEHAKKIVAKAIDEGIIAEPGVTEEDSDTALSGWGSIGSDEEPSPNKQKPPTFQSWGSISPSQMNPNL